VRGQVGPQIRLRRDDDEQHCKLSLAQHALSAGLVEWPAYVPFKDSNLSDTVASHDECERRVTVTVLTVYSLWPLAAISTLRRYGFAHMIPFDACLYLHQRPTYPLDELVKRRTSADNSEVPCFWHAYMLI
jgi:hypothetical protein